MTLETLPNMLPVMSATQERALSLLGSGFPPSIVASSIGVSESLISQFMAQDWFSAQVQELKFLNLQKHTELDSLYDDLEEKLVRKLDKLVPLLIKPMDITRVLQTVNSAKRRGAGAADMGTVTQNIVQLTLPPALMQRFIKNANNQIVEVQDGTGQHNSLVTTSSGSLERLSREAREAEELRNSYSSGTGSEMEPEKTISSQALEKLADSKTLLKRLNESGRTSPALTAQDL